VAVVAILSGVLTKWLLRRVKDTTKVTREQFEISNEGITHKPTGYMFMPNPGNPHLGTIRMGRHGKILASGEDYPPGEVENMMRNLWAEHVGGGN
jgi:hypothetical protein